jgi:hypothetical protein
VRKRVDPSKVTRMRHLRRCRRARAASGVRPDFCPASVRSCSEVPGATLCGKLQARCGWNTRRLQAKDYISSDPKSEAKSVVVTVEGMQRPASCSRNTSGRENRTRVSGRLRGDRNRAIPKREESTSADHGPSSSVPQRARNALRLRFPSGR